jgi:hypothetical protein
MFISGASGGTSPFITNRTGAQNGVEIIFEITQIYERLGMHRGRAKVVKYSFKWTQECCISDYQKIRSLYKSKSAL